MKILVTGAGGFLGHHVVEGLLKRGHDVRAIVRPASPAPKWDRLVEIFRADLRTHDNLVAAFQDVDTVIHMAAATSGGEDAQFTSSVVATERFLEAMAKSTAKRLVLISSLVVYDWSKVSGVMDEESPLLKKPYDMGPYTIAKIWQERVAQKFAQMHKWKLSILRPGFIWGPKHTAIAGMGRRFGRHYLLYGTQTRLPLTHVVNCADCIVAATENPAADDQAFNIVDSDDVCVRRYVSEYARRSGQPGWLLPIPYIVGYGIAQCALLTSRMLFGAKGRLPSLVTPRRYESQFKPVRFSTRKLREVLGWTPPLDFEESLRRSYGLQT